MVAVQHELIAYKVRQNELNNDLFHLTNAHCRANYSIEIMRELARSLDILSKDIVSLEIPEMFKSDVEIYKKELQELGSKYKTFYQNFAYVLQTNIGKTSADKRIFEESKVSVG